MKPKSATAMGKQNPVQRDNIEKLIYKNSNNTFNTYSKTCSSASKLFTKSLILELKKTVPNNDFYESKGKLKRDLSIETDVCRLKRLCKKKIKRSVNQFAVSEKSKYSMNNTEIDTIDEFKADGSGCGDSEPNIKTKNARFNIDLSALVMDNLKSLLNDWIKKYLLENNETKQKIETVLDSILHKLDLQATNTSSSCTYTLDIEIVDHKGSNLDNSEDSKNKRKLSKGSHYTIPLSGNHLKIISTLSVPRNMQKYNKIKKSRNELNRVHNKRVLIPMNTNSNFLLNASSINFLSVSTKTLTKRCATYQKSKDEECVDDKWAKFIPQPSNSTWYSNKRHSKSKIEKQCDFDSGTKNRYLNPDNIPSIYKNIYKDPTSINTTNIELTTVDTNCPIIENKDSKINLDKNIKLSVQDTNKNNKNTLCYPGRSDPLLTIDFKSQSIKFFDRKKKISYKLKKKIKLKKCKRKETRMRRQEKLKKRLENSKYLTCLFNSSDMHSLKEQDLFDRFQTVFKYLAGYKSENDLKFDIHINVFPKCDEEIKNKINKNYTQLVNSTHETLQNSDYTCKTTIQANNKSTTAQNLTESETSEQKSTIQESHIISLLDGAASHAKYLISRETSTENHEQVNNKTDAHCSNIASKSLNIAQEIGELRMIVKNLAVTAEKFVSVHLSKTNQNDHKSQDLQTFSQNKKYKSKEVKPVEELKSKCLQHSKGIQISNISRNSNIISGVKLKKSPKKKPTKELNTRLLKKSTSYRIIDSETILRVTDMTSKAAGITTDKVTDEALTCSFPKSKSLFEVSVGSNKNKLLAFYCDDFIKPEYIYSFSDHEISCPCQHNPSNNPSFIRHSYVSQDYYNQSHCYDNNSYAPVQKHSQHLPIHDKCRMCDDDNIDIDDSGSTICIDIESKSDKKFAVRNRDGVGFWEGFFYCMLLWIPVFVIAWLFYVYIIRDLLDSGNKTSKSLNRPYHKINSSHFPITLNDLGF